MGYILKACSENLDVGADKKKKKYHRQYLVFLENGKPGAPDGRKGIIMVTCSIIV